MKQKSFVTCWILLMISAHLGAQDLVVIVHPENETRFLSKKDLQHIYLNKKVRWNDGGRIVPVMLQRAELQESFLARNVRKTPRQFSTFWKRQIFTGKGVPPTSFTSEQEVIAFVARTPGGIGFVSGKASLKGVRSIEIQEDSS
ncbi:MAG: hypothetical protein QNK37_02645 [Acidobacteriota bacterium]|nr:hypothetical protein [Acidobacteriota bacterium]